MKCGIIVRMDDGGLATQSHNLTRMLRPDRVLIIDSSSFNGAKQHPERFAEYQSMTINGFPTNQQCMVFLRGLTHVITCEIPYNDNLFELARRQGIVSIEQPNPEFFSQFLNPALPAPTKLIAPSPWMIDRFEAMYPGRVTLAPPPTFPEDFADARGVNMQRSEKKWRFTHIVGHRAARDRNGTLSVLEALKHTSADFQLTIRAQPPFELDCADPRVTLDLSNPADRAELYQATDCVLFPRRYAGLALPLCEALMSGLPVVMTDISPNNQLLPTEWLVKATKTGELMTRILLDVYSADPVALAAKIDEFCAMSDGELTAAKERAYRIGYETYSADVLRPRYLELLEAT